MVNAPADSEDDCARYGCQCQHPDAEGPSDSDVRQLDPDQAPPGLRALLEAKAEGLRP